MQFQEQGSQQYREYGKGLRQRNAPREFAAHQATFSGRVIGAVAFGAQRLSATPSGCPYTWVDMPVLNGEVVFDAWISEQPVVRQDAGKIVSARNDVCRSDLLLEVEGVNLNEPGAMH